jgi:hypothetical protein
MPADGSGAGPSLLKRDSQSEQCSRAIRGPMALCFRATMLLFKFLCPVCRRATGRSQCYWAGWRAYYGGARRDLNGTGPSRGRVRGVMARPSQPKLLGSMQARPSAGAP